MYPGALAFMLITLAPPMAAFSFSAVLPMAAFSLSAVKLSDTQRLRGAFAASTPSACTHVERSRPCTFLCGTSKGGDAEEIYADNAQLNAGARWSKHLLFMAFSGAALGPLLDGYHSAFGVLKYTVPKQVFLGNVFVCESDLWVPPMFALAAIILGAAYPILDRVLQVPQQRRLPSVPCILTCISYFCLQYYMSGLLTSNGVQGLPLHLFLGVSAAGCWYAWDRTYTGVIMSLITGIAGPGVEIGLLQGYPAFFGGSELYHYSSPFFMGIPLWIAWVYACGAPAVGGLARGCWSFLGRTE